MLVPGSIQPAQVQYGSLVNELAAETTLVLKDLEVYQTDGPPSGFHLETAIVGIQRAADAAGLDAFHLFGYSAGGGISLAFAAKYPERLKSLALIEPAWIGNEEWGPEEISF